MSKKTYAEKKAEAQAMAIEWQLTYYELIYPWGDIAFYADYFRRIGKRYGLLKEFRENGII